MDHTNFTSGHLAARIRARLRSSFELRRLSMLQPGCSEAASHPPDAHGKRFAFLLGVGKSGTNWAGSLLNLHPKIFCDGEFQFFYFFDAFRSFSQGWWQLGSRPEISSAARAALEDLVRRSMLPIAQSKPAAEWLVDRSPRWFEVFIDGAPHIYMCRDGRDVLVSHMFHHLRMNNPEQIATPLRACYLRHCEAFQRDPNYVTPDSPGLLDEEPWVRSYARRWAEQIRHDFAGIRHVGTTKPATPVLIVRYEDLHRDTERWRSRMYEHLGLDPTEAAPVSANTNTVAGFGREDRSSFYRKGQVGDWRNYASERFKRWFREEAGDVLVELDYENSLNW